MVLPLKEEHPLLDVCVGGHLLKYLNSTRGIGWTPAQKPVFLEERKGDLDAW